MLFRSSSTPYNLILNALLGLSLTAIADNHPIVAIGMAAGGATFSEKIKVWIKNLFSGSNEAELQARLLSANKEAGSIRYQVERELHAKLTAYTDDIMDDISKPLADSKHILDDKSQALLLERETTRELETQLRQLMA